MVPGHLPDVPVYVQLLLEANSLHTLDGQLVGHVTAPSTRVHQQLIIFVQNLLTGGAVYHHLLPLLLLHIHKGLPQFELPPVQSKINLFYATETYIMHFLEPARFLIAPDLAGRKVNLLYAPLWVFTPRCGCLGPETTTLFSFAKSYQ